MRQEVGPGTRTFKVVQRVWIGVYNDGFIHAGNLAYMAILSLFPFFITGAAIFSLVGNADDRTAAINAFLLAVPAVVAEVIEPVARDVVSARTGWLLWAGALFGFWTVGSLIGSIRDILHRAYGTHPHASFLRQRLFFAAVVVGAVLLLMMSLAAQFFISAAQEVIAAWFPHARDLVGALALSRFIPGFGLLFSLWLLFVSLTPRAYRGNDYVKWPGAVLVTVWWIMVSVLLPPALRLIFKYDLTYGSLAGVMIALFFFWLVGLGLVVGAELNAALAETPEERALRTNGHVAEQDAEHTI
ncbi:YihY/virulence factor BrkB family protein [Croceicoccus sp. F390]|uniref:YihY/virulence factor BrkB family protein n=1 Tax=Croceicoccus esteveae TaxID=3075597 RepID=A0ABU2ZJR4_9SPHN|nr:YihY/virulence factor BrkB family protein [Croceicoccus sp. F390]MDT0576848.1 YihY/virulence factor BrkB family protein [Croceicoccus sp. F390]